MSEFLSPKLKVWLGHFGQAGGCFLSHYPQIFFRDFVKADILPKDFPGNFLAANNILAVKQEPPHVPTGTICERA